MPGGKEPHIRPQKTILAGTPRSMPRPRSRARTPDMAVRSPSNLLRLPISDSKCSLSGMTSLQNRHSDAVRRIVWSSENADSEPAPRVSDLPCNIRREGGRSLVIGGPSLVMLGGREGNPL